MASPSNRKQPPTNPFHTPDEYEEMAGTTRKAHSGGLIVPPGSAGAILRSQALHGEYLPGMEYCDRDFQENQMILEDDNVEIKEHPIPDGSFGAILRCQALPGEYQPGLQYCDEDYGKNAVMMDDVYLMIKERATYGDPPTTAVNPSHEARIHFGQSIPNLFGPLPSHFSARGDSNVFSPRVTDFFTQEGGDLSTRAATSPFAQDAAGFFARGPSRHANRASTNFFAQETIGTSAPEGSNLPPRTFADLFGEETSNIPAKNPFDFFATGSFTPDPLRWRTVKFDKNSMNLPNPFAKPPTMDVMDRKLFVEGTPEPSNSPEL